MTTGVSYGSGPDEPLVGQVQMPAGAASEQPSTLAADLMMIMLDGAGGDLRVQPRVAGHALAGALLVELWMHGHIHLADGQVTVVPERPLPGNGLLRLTLGWLLVRPDQTVLTGWLQALAPPLLDQVGDQLEQAGWIRRAAKRRGGVRYQPTQRHQVFWRANRLMQALSSRPAWTDIFLFALVDVTGLTPQLRVEAAYPPSDQQIALLSAGLRQHYPGVADIAAAVRALADRQAIAPH